MMPGWPRIAVSFECSHRSCLLREYINEQIRRHHLRLRLPYAQVHQNRQFSTFANGHPTSYRNRLKGASARVISGIFISQHDPVGVLPYHTRRAAGLTNMEAVRLTSWLALAKVKDAGGNAVFLADRHQPGAIDEVQGLAVGEFHTAGAVAGRGDHNS
jgi:hypothetical protein